jgi:hypothetical protein
MEETAMPYTIRQLAPVGKFTDHITLDLFASTLPADAIDQALTATASHAQRERRLTMPAIVLLIVAMNLWTQCAIPTVFRHLVRGLRWLWPTTVRLPQSNALTYRRYQLGARPLHWLFRQRCQPLATPATPGAFLFGLRLMALDGVVETVADTPENARYFGRQRNDRGDGAFPQAQITYLVECGTHAIVDAGIWPYAIHERVGGARMLRSVGPGMLLMWDCGFHDYRMLARALAQGAHVLTRLPAHVKPTLIAPLPDGSQLVEIRPSDADRRAGALPLRLRLITYQLSDPALGDPTEVHRLLTSLLDPVAYSARTLVCAYHERWEVEITIDEVDTHQRVAHRPFRSHKPVGVIQEFYGMLLAHYAIRSVMHDAAVEVHVDPDRISFVLAIQEIQAAVREFQQTDPIDHPALYRRLLDECRSTLLPPRRPRIYPRVVKQKMSNFGRKRPEHQHWPQPGGPFAEAVCLLTREGNPVVGQRVPPPIRWIATS